MHRFLHRRPPHRRTRRIGVIHRTVDTKHRRATVNDAVRTFLRELEAILATMDEAARLRTLECLRGLVNGFATFKEAVPVRTKAIGLLAGDLVMFMSMGKKGPDVMAKLRTLAKEVGPHVDWLVHAL